MTRILEEQTPRVETGPTKFGDDWCGVFIRGDNAYALAMSLRAFIDCGSATDSIAKMHVQGLLSLLASCDER